MRLLFAAGGTGGHLRPAIALAEAVLERDPCASICFATSGREVDDRFLDGSPYGRVALFDRGGGAPSRANVPLLARAFGRARRLLRDFEPDVVVGFGGYVGALGCAAALRPAARVLGSRLIGRPRRGRTPIVLLEQNARAGWPVRWLHPHADRVLLSLPEAARDLSHDRFEVTGNPLPASLLKGGGAPDPRDFGLEPGRRTLLVLGGSQGARGVNRMLLAARPLLANQCPELQIALLSGPLDYPDVAAALKRDPGPPTVAWPFESRMRELYELSDLVVARAGGTTLSELALVGRALVLVPYPHHRDGHQFENARVFQRAGAAVVCPEGADGPRALARAVTGLVRDPAARDRAAAACRSLGRPDAAKRSAEIVVDVARKAAS